MDYTKKCLGNIAVDELIEFLDAYMADEEGRNQRMEKKRQANKTCQNCKYMTEDGCQYWGDFVDGEEICGQWR